MKKKIEIICTLGPSSLNKKFLKFSKGKIDLLRLNMSHLNLLNLEKSIKFIKKNTNIPICIDTEGAQIRIKTRKSKFLKLNQKVKINKKKNSMNLYPGSIFGKIKKHDVLNVGFHNLKLKVIRKSNDILCKVISSGLFSMMYGGQMVEIYNLREQRGIRRELGIGTHQAWGTIPKAVDSKQDIIYIPITSMKIPNDFQVTLYRNIKADEDITKFTKYSLKFGDEYKNLSKLDLSCCEGVKILTKTTEIPNKNIRELRYRIWKNISRNNC